MFTFILTFYLFFSRCDINIKLFTNIILYQIIWGKKTASSRSILAFEVEKQKLENLKKRKTVFYYLITYTTSYKNIHIYIYIYISLYEENRYLQVNKNDYARCVMYGLSGDMEQHEFLKTEQ